MGFKWWNLTFPSAVDSGANAISDFVAATGGAVNFGGTVPPIQPLGGTYAVWNNPPNANHWSGLWTVLTPVPMPLATVAANWVTTSSGGTFGITVSGGSATPLTVNVSGVTGTFCTTRSP